MNYNSFISYLFREKDLGSLNPYNVPEKLRDNFSKKKAVGAAAGAPNEIRRRVRDFFYSAIFGGLSLGSVGTAVQLFKYDYGYLYDILGKGGADGLGVGLVGAAVPLGYAAYYFLKRALSNNP